MIKEGKPIEKLHEITDQSGFPKKYRKKPVIIRAIELKEKTKIKTREGTLFGEVGDFLIEGIQGEIYPCGREIFFKTYEDVNINSKNRFKVKGRILEIIPKEKHEDYILPLFPHNEESPFFGFYYLLVTETDIPLDVFKSFFKRVIWKLRNREQKDKKNYTIVMKTCPYKVGENVEFEVERYFEPSEIFIKKEDNQ